jgi:hypothetical protein
MEVPDAAMLSSIRVSSAFIVLKNIRKNAKIPTIDMGLNYLRSRNSRIMRDLEFNKDVLLRTLCVCKK